jgi:hypothetical protein
VVSLAQAKENTSRESAIVEDVRPEVTPSRTEKLEIFEGDGWWWASQGVPLEIGYRDQKLSRVTTRLTSVVEAIEEKFPGRYRITVSASITRNPFVKHHIKTIQGYGLAPDFNLIQTALDHPRSEMCTLCRSEAWYNGRIGHYECFKCGATEVGGEFMKIRRRRF